MSQTEVRSIQGIEIPEPGDWQLDPVHTAVEFSARHLMVSKVRGKFHGVSGNIHISDDPLGSWVEVKIDPASVESGDAKRDEHLRSPDFFDVERYPEITFRSTRLEGDHPGGFRLEGDLTVHGVTRPVTLDVEYHGWTTEPAGRPARRLLGHDRGRPRGLRPHLERRPRDGRRPRGQEGQARLRDRGRQAGLTNARQRSLRGYGAATPSPGGARMTPGDSFDELAGDPELEDAAGAAREERRAEEEEYAHAAARQWARHRDLLDITRELQHRGDTVAMQVGESSFRGLIDAVGADYVQLRTATGRVDIALVVGHERTPVPLVIRVVERAREGGRRAEPLARTFRARLLEYDGEEIDAVIGSPLFSEGLRGLLTIGRDHVAVRDADGSDTYLPLDHVAWAHPWRG